jgi:hypothetical protein
LAGPPKSWWRDALSEARKANWHLVVFAGHCWGKVACSPVGSDRCEKLIFSTGRAGESHAKDLIRLIRRCPHPGLEEGLAEARQVLDGAQLLLDAAESCLVADADAAAAEDLLEMALSNVTAAETLMKDDAQRASGTEALLSKAVELEGKARGEMVEAHARAARAGIPASMPVTASKLVGEAAERIDTAAALVGSRSSAGAMHDRIKALRERVEEMRSRLVKP